mgnify:CR=1 FL=1
MDEHRFDAALDRWGSNLQDWPADERQAAEALLAQSKVAESLLQTDRSIDATLSRLQQHVAPPGLEQRIHARLTTLESHGDRGQRIWSWVTASFWRPALLAAVPLTVGFALGLGLSDVSEQELADQVSMLALSNIYEEIDDAQQ